MAKRNRHKIKKEQVKQKKVKFISSITMKIAVYGLLCKHQSHHSRFLSKSNYLGEFETPPSFTLYDLGLYPGLVKDGSTSVRMEVYEINVNELKMFDVLEGFKGENRADNLFIRELMETPYGGAYVYYYANFNKNPIPPKNIECGNWVEHNNKIK